MRRLWKGFLAASVLSVAFSIIGPVGIDWCSQDWVVSSDFWSWYFDCPTSAGGGGSGAGYLPQ